MELNRYQQEVMRHLTSYLQCLNQCRNMTSAWREYWFRQDINVGFGGVPAYNDTIKGAPHVCMKVPTGGGKTFMACASIKKIFDAMPKDKPKVVVWLVPSDPILNQTIRALTDVNHPYRQRLDQDFSGRVGVYTKEQLLDGQRFSPDTVREMLTLCILSYGSLRINSKKKDVRKVYQENGNLLKFAEYFRDRDVLLADTPDTALIQVLRQLSPVTVVDESHNAGSDLSVEMLENLNPSFILDLTATPRKNSNIIAYVDARELKKENMVKLPVVVYNRDSRHSVILDAIQLRGKLEQQALAEEANGGSYIRPIVLFQAQPNIKGKENETYEKIRQSLLDIGIPEEQIAIKTSEKDDIKDVNLLSRDCSVRYIITVNALKEGWDCSFAYILASLANKTSVVDVEQIVGRILRQPYAKRHQTQLLNTSYVFTCSKDFRMTLGSVVTGLNKAGFSKKDYRVGELASEEQSETPQPEVYTQEEMPLDTNPITYEDDFSDISTNVLREQVTHFLTGSSEQETTETADSPELSEIMHQAQEQAQQYEEDTTASEQEGYAGGELGDMLTQNVMQKQYHDDAIALRIPQFFVETTPDLFGSAHELLEKENLSEGFSLSGQDAQISFELATGEMYRVDLQEQGEAVPKYIRVSKTDSEYLREILARLPEEKRQNVCVDNICGIINRNNRYAASEIKEYVHRVVENMSEDELSAMETALPVYARKIQEKIADLEDVYRERQFYAWLDSGKIVCRDSYALPEVITPANTLNAVPYSLYDAEKDDMNNFERRLLDVIAALPNIEWWHRIIERKGFRINGFINHYPDFLVRTKSRRILLIESKGDDRDNSDSKKKLKLGRRWQSEVGSAYRYFMVFDNQDFHEDGAYTIDEFAEIVKNL